MALRRVPLLGVLLVVVASICGVALAAKNYPDKVGDVKGGGGPDIASVTVSNTASTLTFRVRFVSAPPLRVNTREKWVDMVLIGVDVPPLGPRPSIPGGEWPGVDFALGTHGPWGTGMLVRLGEKRSGPPVRIKMVTSGRTLSFTVPRRALGNPRWLTFNVAAAREGESETTGGGLDVAPQRGTFRYVLS